MSRLLADSYPTVVGVSKVRELSPLQQAELLELGRRNQFRVQCVARLAAAPPAGMIGCRVNGEQYRSVHSPSGRAGFQYWPEARQHRFWVLA